MTGRRSQAPWRARRSAARSRPGSGPCGGTRVDTPIIPCWAPIGWAAWNPTTRLHRTGERPPGPGPGRPDQRDRGLPHLRRLAHHLLPLGRPRPTLRAGRAGAQEPPAACDADRGSPDQVEAVLAEAVARPTLGARQLVDHLADRGVRL